MSRKGRKIINVYDSRGVKIAGAFTQEMALGHAKRLAGKGAFFARRGDQIGYSGTYPEWFYIKISEVPS